MKVMHQQPERSTAMEKAADLTPGNIRIRIQPSVYQRDTGDYLSWRGVSWTVVVENEREATRLRSALAAFFVRLDRVGLDFMLLELEAKNLGLPVPQQENSGPDSLSLTDSQG